MPLIASDTGNGQTFDPVAEGVHIGICYSVVDLGTHLNKQFNKEKHQVCFTWEIPAERIEIEKDGEKKDLPRVVSKITTLSLGEKANLRKMLQSWRGKAFTPEELKGFDLKNVLGAPCQILVVHNKGADGKTYANVDSVMPAPKGVELPQDTENPKVYFCIADSDGAIPESVPEWQVNKIKMSKEWDVEDLQYDEDATTVNVDGEKQDEDNLPF